MGIEFHKIEFYYDKPDIDTDKGVIIIPDINVNALTSPKIDQLSESLKKAGFCVLRFNMWDNESHLYELTINEINLALHKAIKKLTSQDYKKIYLIGEGFGANLLLSYSHKKIRKIVIWNPSFSYNSKSNIAKAKYLKLSRYKSLSNIKLNTQDLRKINNPILIIHNQKNTKIHPNNSISLSKHIKKSKLEIINKNSISDQSDLDSMINKTIDFLIQE